MTEQAPILVSVLDAPSDQWALRMPACLGRLMRDGPLVKNAGSSTRAEHLINPGVAPALATLLMDRWANDRPLLTDGEADRVHVSRQPRSVGLRIEASPWSRHVPNGGEELLGIRCS